jgi:glutamate synthase (ferredoxin)
MYDPRFEHEACGIGMLVNIKGKKSHKTVTDAVTILKRLTHRGGAGSEPDTGDGAGMLVQLPHEFFKRALPFADALPPEGGYGVAMTFLSPDGDRGQRSVGMFKGVIESEGLRVIGVRPVPVYTGSLGETAFKVRPAIAQVFIEKPESMTEERFERKLYIISKLAHKAIRETSPRDKYFYIASISSQTVVYKGMLTPSQLTDFYLDLKDERFTSALALVHSRFSTNTFPSWERAHPMRYIAHNGEINTIRGNVNWVKARESALRYEGLPEFGKDFPVINEDGSDSAMLDDFVSLLTNAGYPLHEAVMTAIPEPWENDDAMDEDKKAFYRFKSSLCEPWDGPSAIVFAAGKTAGATLDRNGLRPARWCLCKDGTLILASETGVLDVPDGEVVKKDRLRPGKMLLIDIEKGKIIDDAELKRAAAKRLPYKKWVKENTVSLSGLPDGNGERETFYGFAKRLWKSGDLKRAAVLKELVSAESLRESEDTPDSALMRKIFGYTYEDLNLTLRGIVQTGEDPVSSMGADTPLAALSNRPQLLYNYFKQLFAQVTNPPIDAIREQIITSSNILLGGEGNLLNPGPECCRRIEHGSPVLSTEEFNKIAALNGGDFDAVTIPALFVKDGENALYRALNAMFAAADAAVAEGKNILILSDKGVGADKAPVPMLLAVSGLHHHLIRKGARTRVSIIAETGEAREVHHMAALVGYGANAVCPFLAYRTLLDMRRDGLTETDGAEAIEIYRKALTKGIVKIMSKMGISTVRSYHGAQVFEALGISEEVVDEYFAGTVSRVGGLKLSDIEKETLRRHEAAVTSLASAPLEAGGDYKWRRDGEYHLFNPENIYYLQQSCRRGDYEMFKKFSDCVNFRGEQVKNIRGLLNIVTADKPLPIESVEPETSIVKRFKTGAMSYGSISGEAHECMAIAMNRLGAKSNTGEGGEMPERFKVGENGENRCSAIKQVASGRFGVTIEYLNNAREIQIKMAQGAKPGEGGHLPGRKVYPWIAKSRHSTPGVDLISPPPHHDIYSIEDLAQLIHDLKNANPRAAVSVKLVSEAGVGTVAVGVAKGLADVIVVSGYDGGTGAAPRTGIRHAGLPWELGVAEAHQSLILNDLRDRVTLETDGKLLTGRDVIVAALLGAEEFAFATAPLVVLGCDMMRVCNLDTCPVGIATQNPALRKKFAGKPEHIENLMLFLAREVREWMARIGVPTFGELVGRSELLRQKRSPVNEKTDAVDLSNLLYRPKSAGDMRNKPRGAQRLRSLQNNLDHNTLIPLCEPAIERGGRVEFELPINNTNRSTGCMLSGEIAKKFGAEGLKDDSIRLTFSGSAGQSFAAFLSNGVTMELIGDANDYVGKGMSGGRVIVRPPQNTPPGIIAGNVAFYGATGGEAYLAGEAGERFCVRNSGARVVVEGVGDQGLEYMTGGAVVILGSVGRNFGAGFSGGIAFVYDRDGDFRSKCNKGKLILSPLDDGDLPLLNEMLTKHAGYTGSPTAQKMLADFAAEAKLFVKIIPEAYKKITDAIKEKADAGGTPDECLMYAFNKTNGGNK